MGNPGFTDHLREKISELAELPEGWDGRSARRLRPDIVRTAIAVAESLPPDIAERPAVVPMVSGALQFEWHRPSRVLELEFESPTTVHYLKWDRASGSSEEDTFSASDLNRIAGLMRWFSKGI